MKMRWQRIIVPLFLLLASAQSGQNQPSAKAQPGKGIDAAKVAAPADFAPHVAVWAGDGKLMLVSQTHATLEDVAAGKRLGVWQHAGFGADTPLSADGTRLLVIESKPGPGAMGLSIVPIAGGDAIPLKAPKEGGKFSFLAWDKGGDRLLLSDEKQVRQWWDARTGARTGAPVAARPALRIPKDTTVRDFAVGRERLEMTIKSDTQYSYQAINTFNSSGSGTGGFGWAGPLSSPDGRFLLTPQDGRGSNQYRFAALWDGRTGEFLSLILRVTDDPENWSFLPGDRLAMILHPKVEIGEKPRSRVLLFDPTSGATLAELRTQSAARRLEWSANGETLYVLGSSGAERHLIAWFTNVEVWNLATGERTQTIPLAVENRKTRDVAFSPDGKRLALVMTAEEGEKDLTIHGEVRVYDAVTEKLVLREVLRDGIRDFGNNISWQPTGNYLMTANRVWDARTGRLVATLAPSNDRGLVASAAWSPDGASLAAIVRVKRADAPRAVVIDLKTGKTIRLLQAPDKDSKEKN